MRRNQVDVFIHLVWSTWDRLPLLIGSIERQVYRAIEAKCEELGVPIIALGGVEDHMHLLIQLSSTLSVAQIIKEVKGSTSHLIGHTHGSQSFFRWQGSYGAFSVSRSHIAIVANYIAQQKEHHKAMTLIPEWEMPADEPTSADG